MKLLSSLPLLALGAAAVAVPAGPEATLPVQCPDAARFCNGRAQGQIACRCPLQRAPCQTFKCDERNFVRSPVSLNSYVGAFVRPEESIAQDKAS